MSEETAEPVAEPKPRLQNWQKFAVDREIIGRVRVMLSIADDEELPEALWVMMGIRKALERCFGEISWGFSDVATMITNSQLILGSMRNQTNYIPGSLVRCTNLNLEGHYWHPGPLGRHLINCFGDVYLVKTEDLEIPESAIKDSPLNVNARHGELLAEVQEQRTPDEADALSAAALVADFRTSGKGALATVS